MKEAEISLDSTMENSSCELILDWDGSNLSSPNIPALIIKKFWGNLINTAEGRKLQFGIGFIFI